MWQAISVYTLSIRTVPARSGCEEWLRAKKCSHLIHPEVEFGGLLQAVLCQPRQQFLSIPSTSAWEVVPAQVPSLVAGPMRDT